jgi:hypothetical protein
VLDQAEPPAAATRSASWGIAGTVAAIALTALVVGQVGPPPSNPVVPPPPASLAGPSPTVPDLVGLDVDAASAVLDGSGFRGPAAVPAQSWIASAEHPAGHVVAQWPASGSTLTQGRIEVEVSAGGPVVGSGDLPAEIRTWASTLPGFDEQEPILLVPTPHGPAYKTDRWLFGTCDAVPLAAGTLPDPSYGEDCIAVTKVSLSGVLPDGTSYEVTGLPEGEYVPVTASGGIVFAPAGHEPRALGITRYARQVPGVSPSVSWRDATTLVIAAGEWTMEVAVSPELAAGPQRDELLAAIDPQLVADHLVISLAPPLRFQRPGELPSRMAVEYGEFRVVAGCVAGVGNSRCGSGGAISVEGARSGFDVSGVSIRVGDAIVPHRETRWFVDPASGLRVISEPGV